MKASEIQVGGLYVAKVSGKLATVRVDAIRDYVQAIWSGGHITGDRVTKRYEVTNLNTNRRTTFRSAAKFRRALRGPNETPVSARPAAGRLVVTGDRLEVFRGGVSQDYIGFDNDPSEDWPQREFDSSVAQAKAWALEYGVSEAGLADAIVALEAHRHWLESQPVPGAIY